MQRHRLIPAPSFSVLSSDWHETVPGGPDPVVHVQTRDVEPIPFRQVELGPRDSDFNTRPSFVQRIYDLWWPGQSTWQETPNPSMGIQGPGPFASVAGTKTLIGEPFAAMPLGFQMALGLRKNIRQPQPFGQGELSDVAVELYPTEE